MQEKKLNSKIVILGISGGIAAYKCCDLVRLLVKKEIDVHVIMTKAAQKFITPLTMQTLTGHEVHTDMFDLNENFQIEHISIANKASAIVIAPATADIIAKLSVGICDDLLTTTVMATKAPVIICPSMNTNMWEKPVLQANLEKLRGFGYRILEPIEGDLACGTIGMGKLPDPEAIVRELESLLR